MSNHPKTKPDKISYSGRIYFLVALLWMAVIYFFSDQPGSESPPPSATYYIVRKMAHVGEYFILTFLFIKAFSSIFLDRREAVKVAAVWAFLFALSDEWHQVFVFGRSGNFLDVAVDALGIILAVATYLFLGKFFKKTNNEKK